jgi:hypothetical protein
MQLADPGETIVRHLRGVLEPFVESMYGPEPDSHLLLDETTALNELFRGTLHAVCQNQD